MQFSLYAKFLGEAIPLEQAKTALADARRRLAGFTVADFPNASIILDVNRKKCKLGCSWKDHGWWPPESSNFRKDFNYNCLNSVVPPTHGTVGRGIPRINCIPFWKSLEVDDCTLNRSRAKFASVCVELHLNQRLTQGTWGLIW